jgi:ATP phosphoribosyltransferase
MSARSDRRREARAQERGLVLAVPSKGRLQEQTAEFLADCGLSLTLEPRFYSANIRALPKIEVRLLSATDIARALREGEIHAGVTGEDVLCESDPDLASAILVKPLGFGRADLVVAAPTAWLDVASISDFAEVCADHRALTGVRLRVATKYLNLTRRFFDAHGVMDYRLVESLGATEGAPASGAAEAIVDITTTGATLAANHLRPLVGGAILKSQAQLAASRRAPWNDDALGCFAEMLDAIEARGRAKMWRILRVAPGPDGSKLLVERAVALGCTVAPGDPGGVVELHCPEDRVFALCAALADARVTSVGVFKADFLFERPNAVFEIFRSKL